MFRGPQILTHCGLIRPLLLRESHLAMLSEHICAGWQGATRVLSSTVLPCISLTRGVCHLKSRDPAKLSPPFKECTRVAGRPLNPEAVSRRWDSFSKTTCHHPRRPWDIFQPSLSFTNKTHGQHLVGSFNFGPQLHQSRPIHQACPRVTDAWRDCLSAENESRCRQSLEPNLKFYEMEKARKSGAQGKNQGRWASVLVSLCCVGGEPAFLFTLRSSTLKGRHKGDVSFAGGKSDPSDTDVVATALREAREELGVTVATNNVWGVLKPLRDMSGMLVAPVLANFGPLEELSFKPNPGEVEEIFTLSLSHLCNPQNRGYTHFRTGDKYGYTLPVFRNGKHRVWGLTAVALDHTLKLVIPS